VEARKQRPTERHEATTWLTLRVREVPGLSHQRLVAEVGPLRNQEKGRITKGKTGECSHELRGASHDEKPQDNSGSQWIYKIALGLSSSPKCTVTTHGVL
jgi:hypothetical protein